MRIELERDGTNTWSLYVNGRLEISEESYAIVHGVADALCGHTATDEILEVANEIRRAHA
jgi:hypothetical protein